MSDNNDRQDVFCGRADDLQFLKDKWKQVSNPDNPKPQVAVLLAEPGLGKTRLVQEFYGWLSENEDKDNYWPTRLGAEGENLRVNPVFSATDKRPAMPFLWWGVRFNKSKDRNQQFGSALPGYLSSLIPHFYELHAARERASAILKGGGLLINLATLGSIQLIQSISELANLGFSAVAIARDKYLSQKNKANKDSVKNIQSSHLDDQVDILHQDFRTMMSLSIDKKVAWQDALKVMKGKENIENVMATMRTVPTVIFFDDSQWIDEDALSLITKLMEDAKSNNWPLMIIITCWESEWEKSKEYSDTKNELVSLAESYSEDIRILDKISGLESMLKREFPKLTSIQEKIIINRIDGNPGYMEAVIRDLKDEPEYFVDENVGKPLTSEGEKYIQSQECDFFRITEKMFKKLPLELRKALRWATYHGVEFSEQLSLFVYHEMIGEFDSKVGFDMAESPFCFISREKRPMAEFRQNIYYEVANKRLQHQSGERDRLKQATKKAILMWINSNDQKKFNDSELGLILNLADTHLDKNKSEQEILLNLFSKSKDYYRETKQMRTVNHISDFEAETTYLNKQYSEECFTPEEQYLMETDHDELEMHDAMVDIEKDRAYDPIQDLSEALEVNAENHQQYNIIDSSDDSVIDEDKCPF